MRFSPLARRFSKTARASWGSAGLALLLAAGCASAPPPKPPPTEAAAGTPDVPVSALVGNWLFEIEMGTRTVEGSLHFTNANGVVAGTWTSAEGNEYELKDIRIQGNVISWTGDGPAGSQVASGTIDGTSMKGTMKRAARRGSGDGSTGSSGSGSRGGSDDAAPAPDGDAVSRGGGRRGGGGGRGGGRRASANSKVTWSAYKSAPESPAASPTPVVPQ